MHTASYYTNYPAIHSCAPTPTLCSYYCAIANGDRICNCTIIATRRWRLARDYTSHKSVYSSTHGSARTHTHTHRDYSTPYHTSPHQIHTHTPHTTTGTHASKPKPQRTLSSNEKVPYKHGDKSCNLIFLAVTFICSLTY